MSNLKHIAVMIAAVLFCGPAGVWAETPAADESAEQFMDSMTLQKGKINLPNGIAALDVPKSFRYLGPEDSRRFLEEAWGNPDGSGQIGMLLPVGTDPLGEKGWAVVISYEEDGYVSDKDASKIDYAELLKKMQASTLDSNKQREKMGFPPVTLVGWAAAPRYDSQTKKLYWAKELRLGDEDKHNLNYNVRILGRKGVLVLNAVSYMDQLPMVRERMEQVIGFADFNPGYRYAEFDPGMDKVAAYGIAALIAGKAAAKVGILAKLGGVLVAFKKIFIVGFLALAGLFRKLFKRRKPESKAELRV
jgi:uncharacterized membrane-anchored protein